MSKPIDAVAAAPRRPGPRARRFVCGWLATVGLGLPLLALALSATLVPALLMNWRAWEDVVIAIASESTEGVVVERTVDTTVKIQNQHPVTLGYELADGRVGACSTTDAELGAVQVGGTVQVELSSLVSSWHRVEGATVCAGWPITALMFVFPAAGVVMAIVSWRIKQRVRRVYVHGVPAVATAEQTTASRALVREFERLGEAESTQLAWRFSASDGRIHHGAHAGGSSDEQRELLGDGDVIVLYLPEAPGQSVLYID